MAIQFPSSPTIGQQVESSVGTVYRWNGTVWTSIPATNSIETKNLVKAGAPVTSNTTDSLKFDAFEFRVAPSGNRSLQVRTIDGTNKTLAFSTYYNNNSMGGTINQLSIGPTSWAYFVSGYTFGNRGDTQYVVFYDTVTYNMYRVTMSIGNAYNNNPITAERLWL
jgi:hypothetical protein